MLDEGEEEMIGNKKEIRMVGGIALSLMLVAFVAQADISYMTVSEGASTYAATYTNAFTVVGDAGTIGTAGIESHAWSDGTYWYYSYQIFNNDATTEGVNNFGHTVCNPGDPEGIYSFSVTVADAPGGVDNLEISGYAASTGGGGAWGGVVDSTIFPVAFIEGASWAVNQTGAAVDAEPIAPTQWEDTQGGPQVNWVIVDPGDESTDDVTGQYFQFVSTWAPGEVQGSIVADGSLGGVVQAGGGVLGPAVIPEPATLIVFALGSLGLIGGRRIVDRLL